eukprot:GHVS01049438.1.p1 GENE.GHVS01049438.1~~GHVS01049438.1.p1  ORF type:complete len:452 (-),score=54.67 GHVS01049438.1:1222-2496(-)
MSPPFQLLLVLPALCWGLSVSRSKICSESSAYEDQGKPRACKEVLTGTLTLQNEQNERMNISQSNVLGRDAVVHDAGNVGLNIDIFKTKVSFAYKLKYIIDVFDRFEEDVSLHTWAEVGDSPADFCYRDDLAKCAQDGVLAVTPEGDPLPWSSGRCCWCPDTLVVEKSTSQYQRATFNCNWLDLLFNNGVWTSKSCPRVHGPWYSALEIGEWTWYYSIEINMTWWAPPKSSPPPSAGSSSSCLGDLDCDRVAHRDRGMVQRSYRLNLSNPEIYDEEYDVRFRIRSSNPQTAQEPPDLSSSVLFIPSYPKDHALVQQSNLQLDCASNSSSSSSTKCLSNALLLDKSYVDLTGLTCNKVGTSTRTWGDMNGQFCSYRPGSCMGNQIGSFREVAQMPAFCSVDMVVFRRMKLELDLDKRQNIISALY